MRTFSKMIGKLVEIIWGGAGGEERERERERCWLPAMRAK